MDTAVATNDITCVTYCYAVACGGLVENRREPLSLSFDTDLAKKGQGGVIVQVAPGPQVNEQAWLELIRTESDQDIARRLGITDRQVRRIKTGKVSVARLREHAKADPKHKKEDGRLRPRRARAAFLLLRRAVDWADSDCPIAA